jgi:glucose-6-phosphate 1-dehydrogenase
MPAENPFLDPLRFERRVPECAVVIFGANGDLTKRKLMPALYRLAYDRRLSAGFAVVGSSRTPLSDQQFREKMLEAVKQFSENTRFDQDVWNTFAEGLFYVPGDIGDAGLYGRLAAKLAEVETARHTGGNVLFYLSTQPSYYGPAACRLGEAGLGKGNGWRRLIVEKPFGHDLASARALSDELHQVFNESDVYRIDHYLGKETVQNILAFRFGNGIFEPLWNRRYVNHVQITAAESIGVEGRGGYYEEAGALADMIQNHLLQVMATIAMEPSASFRATSVRDERSKLLRSIRPMTAAQVREDSVPGQYGPAQIGGQDIPGFRQEPGVHPDSQTDTYAAVTFFVDNWRWAGVPFYVRTGKRLPKRVTEIAIQFNQAPLAIFEDEDGGEPAPNVLIVRIQPEEGISLKFLSKRPGAGMTLRPVSMDFNYGSSFGERSPSAYETLLLDAIIGDATLYTRQDMVEASWAVVEPIQTVWRETKFAFPNYPAGSWGPAEADRMLARRGHAWRRP